MRRGLLTSMGLAGLVAASVAQAVAAPIARLLSQWLRPATVHSNKCATTMADIIGTVTTIVIMRIAFTGMAVGIIIGQHRGHW